MVNLNSSVLTSLALSFCYNPIFILFFSIFSPIVTLNGVWPCRRRLRRQFVVPWYWRTTRSPQTHPDFLWLLTFQWLICAPACDAGTLGVTKTLWGHRVVAELTLSHLWWKWVCEEIKLRRSCKTTTMATGRKWSNCNVTQQKWLKRCSSPSSLFLPFLEPEHQITPHLLNLGRKSSNVHLGSLSTTWERTKQTFQAVMLVSAKNTFYQNHLTCTLMDFSFNEYVQGVLD